jgi:hypothetical protein
MVYLDVTELAYIAGTILGITILIFSIYSLYRFFTFIVVYNGADDGVDHFRGAGDPPDAPPGSKEWHEWFRKVVEGQGGARAATAKEISRAIFEYFLFVSLGVFGMYYVNDVLYKKNKDERDRLRALFRYVLRYIHKISYVIPRQGAPVYSGIYINPSMNIGELNELALFVSMIEIFNIDKKTMSFEEIQELLDKNKGYIAWASREHERLLIKDLENFENDNKGYHDFKVQPLLDEFIKRNNEIRAGGVPSDSGQFTIIDDKMIDSKYSEFIEECMKGIGLKSDSEKAEAYKKICEKFYEDADAMIAEYNEDMKVRYEESFKKYHFPRRPS